MAVQELGVITAFLCQSKYQWHTTGAQWQKKKPVSVYLGEVSLGKSVESKKQLKLPISETQEWEESC